MSAPSCSACGAQVADPAERWPDSKDGTLCQVCWETECSRQWWAFVIPLLEMGGGMSTNERAAIIARLRVLSRAMWQPREIRDSEFTMRIPAEPLRDADLVMSTAADMLEEGEWDEGELTA